MNAKHLLVLIGIVVVASSSLCSAQNSARLGNVYWPEFVGLPLYSLLMEVNLSYRPYHIQSEVDGLLYLALLYRYSATEDMQVHVYLQPRVDGKWKLYLWDSLSTVRCWIDSIDTELIAKVDDKTAEDAFCIAFVYYEQVYNKPEYARQLYFLRDHPLHELDPAIQAMVRQAYNLLAGEKKLVGTPAE